MHALALFFNDFFEPNTLWKRYINRFNKVIKYFSYHAKASVKLREIQEINGITHYFLHKLKHYIPTRWHSQVGSMLTYLTDTDNISSFFRKLNISSDYFPTLTTSQKNTFAEFIHVLAEVHRVARQIEADQKVTMSISPVCYEKYSKLFISWPGVWKLKRSPFKVLRIPQMDWERTVMNNFTNTSCNRSLDYHCKQIYSAR